MVTQSIRLYWRRVTWAFFPFAMLFAIMFLLLYWYILHSSMTSIQSREKNLTNLYSQHIDADLNSVFSDLKFLVNQYHLQLFLEGDLSTRKEMENEYLSFIKEKGLYDQVRFLDKSGMERIRVNYNRGNPQIVPDEKLQNKASRYYFADAYALGANEIFISPLDLNVEGGKIESPIKPMIRFGMVVFDSNGNKRGVLLFNYLGSRLLKVFDYSAFKTFGESMLINRDGYWLKGLDEEDEWGFMYPTKKTITFKNRFQAEWGRINGTESGQFLTKNGLFTYITVRPLEIGLEKVRSSQLNYRDYHWKVVSQVTPEKIAQRSLFSRQVSITVFIIVCGLSLAIAIIKTRSNLSKERAEKAIQQKNIILEEEHNRLETALLEIVDTNQQLQKTFNDLKSAQAQLLHAEKMQSVGQLAAGVAHEINTPIQFVGDNLRFVQESIKEIKKLMEARDRLVEVAEMGQDLPELAKKAKLVAEEIDLDYLKQEIPQAIQQSLDGIDRVAGIVRAMKEFSHPGTGEKALVDLNSAIKNTAIMSRSEWKYHAELEMNLDPELPDLYCYIGEISQVVLNIIINAVHAIQQKGVAEAGIAEKIQITTSRNENHIILRISDTGAGIPENIRTNIFDPFFTTKEVGQGTGQGLAIAYSCIVDKHSGTIEVESEEGKGTTFIITLPLDPKFSA